MDKPKEIVERTYQFALRVIKLCQALDKLPGVSRVLSKQILRCGTSIGANVEEGQAGQSKADFINKYNIALKEARETNYWLRLLGDSEIIPKDKIKELLDESVQLTKILAQIIINSRNSNLICFFTFYFLLLPLGILGNCRV
jgi:four helix bundle protein